MVLMCIVRQHDAETARALCTSNARHVLLQTVEAALAGNEDCMPVHTTTSYLCDWSAVANRPRIQGLSDLPRVPHHWRAMPCAVKWL